MKTRIILYAPVIALIVEVWLHAHWSVALAITCLTIVVEVHDLAASMWLKQRDKKGKAAPDVFNCQVSGLHSGALKKSNFPGQCRFCGTQPAGHSGKCAGFKGAN